jgi:exonuclease III
MTTHAKETIGGISVYVPTGTADMRSKQLAARLKTVRGARIGILDNCKEFADLVLRGVAEVLKRDHGVAEVKFWRKDYLGIPSKFAPEMAAQCDAVINGVGH